MRISDWSSDVRSSDLLVSSEVRPAVESVVNDKLGQWFEEHPAEARRIVQKVVEAAAAREAARTAKELTRREGALAIANLPGKPAHRQPSDPADYSLFIAEADSPGGPDTPAPARRFPAT